MPFQRDALAFSFLLFSVVFTVWLVSGPPGWVALHEWQTLMASFVALGAASLAYKAAMAKVEFDRQTYLRTEKSRTLGMCLRLSFALNVLRHEAEALRNSIPSSLHLDHTSKQVKAIWFSLKEPDALVEAWNHLESVPPWIAEGLSVVQGYLYDLAQAKDICGEMVWEIKFAETIPPELKQVRLTADKLSDAAKKVRTDLESLIDRLHGY
jgi:hypothetical protein